MEECDISFASPEATADQVNAIKRRSAAGNAGPVCVARYAAYAVDNDNRKGRFKWLRDFFDPLSQGYD